MGWCTCTSFPDAWLNEILTSTTPLGNGLETRTGNHSDMPSGTAAAPIPDGAAKPSEPPAAEIQIGVLSGFTVAVTADRRSEEQAELFARRGATVIRTPVIRTLPLADGPGLTRATESLIDNPPDVVALSTGLGTRSWFSAAEGLDLGEALLEALRPARVLARGPKAAGAALTAGLDVSWRTPTARNREMVEELARAAAEDGRSPSDVRVAVQLDGAPGQPLADQIAALGYEVVAVPVYRWELPTNTAPAERLVQQVADRAVDIVTFTAAHAVANFLTIVEASGRMTDVIEAFASGDVTAVCVGPVCAERAEAGGIPATVVPDHTRLGAMVQACAFAFTDRARQFLLAGQQVRMQGRLVAISGQEPVSLSDRERDVLQALARKPSAVVAKAALLREVWGEGESDEHLVEVTVARLRQRLGPAGAGVETVVRRGYRLSPD